MHRRTIIKKNLKFRVRKLNDKYILMANNDCYELNEVSLSIWEKINGSNSIDDIIKLIGEDYAIPIEKIENEILDFIENMATASVIVKQIY